MFGWLYFKKFATFSLREWMIFSNNLHSYGNSIYYSKDREPFFQGQFKSKKVSFEKKVKVWKNCLNGKFDEISGCSFQRRELECLRVGNVS